MKEELIKKLIDMHKTLIDYKRSEKRTFEENAVLSALNGHIFAVIQLLQKFPF